MFESLLQVKNFYLTTSCFSAAVRLSGGSACVQYQKHMHMNFIFFVKGEFTHSSQMHKAAVRV